MSSEAAAEGLPAWVKDCGLQAEDGSLRRTLKLEIAGGELGGRVEARLREMTPRVRLDGFRPGKVPAAVVRQRFFASARAEALEKMSGEAVQAALRAQQLRPAGGLRITSMEPKGGAAPEDGSPGDGSPGDDGGNDGQQGGAQPDWSLQVEFEVYPQVEFMDLSKIAVKRLVGKVRDAEVEDRAEQFRNMVADWKDVQRKAQEGDLLQLDVRVLSGSGEELQKARQQRVELREEGLPPPLLQALTGAGQGDSGETSLAGEGEEPERAVVWHWTLLQVQERELLDWEDPQLAERLGMGEESKEAGEAEAEGEGAPDEQDKAEPQTQRERLLQMCRQGLESEAKRLSEKKFHGDLLGELERRHALPVPQTAVEREAEAMLQRLGMPEGTEAPEQVRQEATKRVRLGVLIAALSEQQGLEPDEDWIRGRMREDASRQGDPEGFMRWAGSSDEYLRGLETEATQNEAIKYLAGVVQVEEESLGMEELRRQADGEARAA